MAYIDETFYEDEYFGVDAGAEFNRFAKRASDDIDANTMNSIVLADLDAGQLAGVKNATAAQVEFYVQNGDTYNEDGAASESIGSYSYSGGAKSGKSSVALCPRARAYLEQTGLMSRAVVMLRPRRCV